MTDIVTSIRDAVCLPDTGCISMTTCICDIMQDAADEIERLRAMNDEARNEIQRRCEEVRRLREEKKDGD